MEDNGENDLGRRVGRPSLMENVSTEQFRARLDHLVSKNYTWCKIAELMQVSTSWLLKWRTANGYEDPRATVLSHDELDHITRHFAQLNPDSGETMLASYLEAMHIHVSREELRNSVRRVDPEGRAQRLHANIRRRQYDVAGPHHLWHIDGNLKLIHFNIVIHGGIDGFSRNVVYVGCSDNNTAATVLSRFQEGVARYGCPSRVRCDKGREHYEVGRFMLQHRGTGRGSIITGRSVHNQRIERFWRDCRKEVINVYKDQFYYIEQVCGVNFDSPLSLFTLHFLFLTRINEHLEFFRCGWNKHKLRTEHNQTPEQLLLSNAHLAYRGPEVVNEEEYGVEEPEFIEEHITDTAVHPIACPLTSVQFAYFRQHVRELSFYDGVEVSHWPQIYLHALNICIFCHCNL